MPIDAYVGTNAGRKRVFSIDEREFSRLLPPAIELERASGVRIDPYGSTVLPPSMRAFGAEH